MLYLVCGLPGAGKTTRSKHIATRAGALHLCADDWLIALGKSLMDFEFRVPLQDCLLAHAKNLLHHGLSVVVEFGSWHRSERETIRRVAANAGARTELHYLSAPLDELVRRVRERGGPDAEALASSVLLEHHGLFEVPGEEEIACFDRYVGPNDTWPPR